MDLAVCLPQNVCICGRSKFQTFEQSNTLSLKSRQSKTLTPCFRPGGGFEQPQPEHCFSESWGVRGSLKMVRTT